MKHHKNLHLKEAGMVSILVTMFLMLIITLIVIGFAKIIRRDQRQVLDRQLSTQAFYSAESGVNDAINVLKTNPSAAKATCGADATYTNNGILDAASGTAYTCLLVNPSPTSLIYDNVDTSSAKSIPINSSAAIGSITLSWQDTDGGTSFSNCPTLPGLPQISSWSASNNCDAGMLRIDLVPTSGSLSRAGLANGLTAFLYPQSGAVTPTSFTYASASGSNAGAIVGSNCNFGGTPRLCSVTIDVSSVNSSNFYLHAISIYKPNGLTVTAKDGSGNILGLSGAQALVDATGKANDVLRRIAVRVDTSNTNTGVPIGAIQSTSSICKRIVVGPGFATYDPSGVPLGLDTSSCQP